MANTATLVDTEPVQVGRATPVYEYEISIDTTNEDLTVRTAASDKRLWVVGHLGAETNAATITLKSGSSKSKVFEFAANQPVIVATGKQGYIFSTKAGEALVIRASAAVNSLTLRVVEADRLYFD